ncbi:hypothetical protein ACP70R_048689 [Stipagrostis hirtigluma subsp. patula]
MKVARVELLKPYLESRDFIGIFRFPQGAQGLYSQLVPTLALCGILVYYAAYSVGMGPVPWVIMSEIFSIDMKAIAGSFVTLGTFFLFSAASLVTLLFVARLVPETKGRTLEEIQESLKASA